MISESKSALKNKPPNVRRQFASRDPVIAVKALHIHKILSWELYKSYMNAIFAHNLELGANKELLTQDYWFFYYEIHILELPTPLFVQLS